MRRHVHQCFCFTTLNRWRFCCSITPCKMFASALIVFLAFWLQSSLIGSANSACDVPDRCVTPWQPWTFNCFVSSPGTDTTFAMNGSTIAQTSRDYVISGYKISVRPGVVGTISCTAYTTDRRPKSRCERVYSGTLETCQAREKKVTPRVAESAKCPENRKKTVYLGQPFSLTCGIQGEFIMTQYNHSRKKKEQL